MPFLTQSSTQYHIGDINVPILQMGKLRCREAMGLAVSSTGGRAGGLAQSLAQKHITATVPGLVHSLLKESLGPALCPPPHCSQDSCGVCTFAGM